MAWRVAGLALVLVLIARTAFAVGFEERSGTDTDGRPLRLAIWYPSDAPPTGAPNRAGQTLAVDGAITPGRHPLIVVSHGAGGDLLAHADTAYALANAGYVVAAVAHNGNTYADDNAPRAQYMSARPRQISRAIDYMLDGWDQRQSLDPARIGVFGFSLGGYTALIVAGATPDPATAARLCQAHPRPECPPGIVRDFAGGAYAAFPASIRPDARIRVAVAAAPSYGWIFDAKALSGIDIPVQLWIAERDRAGELMALGKRLPQPPELHIVRNAAHLIFARPCNRNSALESNAHCVSDPGIDEVKFHEEMNAAIKAFFDRTLQ
jgi:predicted dienelactone hydrolase